MFALSMTGHSSAGKKEAAQFLRQLAGALP
jgi:dephospho-CoA kinase